MDIFGGCIAKVGELELILGGGGEAVGKSQVRQIFIQKLLLDH